MNKHQLMRRNAMSSVPSFCIHRTEGDSCGSIERYILPTTLYKNQKLLNIQLQCLFNSLK